MAIGEHKRAVGVFSTHREAEQALSQLRDTGFPMDKVSVIARDAGRDHEIAGADVSDRVGNKADDGAKTGALAGGALGGLTGLLVGLGAVAIPGIGPVMLAGAGATALATTLSGGVIGAAAGGLLGALVGLGIPEERARIYNSRVAQGDYLVLVEGTQEEIIRAESLLRNHGIQEWGVYDAPDLHNSGVNKAVSGLGSEPVVKASPLSSHDQQTVKLYEERLVVDKDQVKTGEVNIGKHVETETARVSIPVEKERIVVERTKPMDTNRPVASGEATFQEGEVARIEVYEETADIEKQAFVREQINVRKEVQHDTVEVEDKIRREALDIDAQGRNVIDRTDTL